MNICIGGELEGQIVDKDCYKFKVEPDNEKGPYYYRQSVILEDHYLRFWFSSTVKFGDAIRTAEHFARKRVRELKGT
jgi:hypothetical protein